MGLLLMPNETPESKDAHSSRSSARDMRLGGPWDRPSVANLVFLGIDVIASNAATEGVTAFASCESLRRRTGSVSCDFLGVIGRGDVRGGADEPVDDVVETGEVAF